MVARTPDGMGSLPCVAVSHRAPLLGNTGIANTAALTTGHERGGTGFELAAVRVNSMTVLNASWASKCCETLFYFSGRKTNFQGQSS
jgi:hypothetical protein